MEHRFDTLARSLARSVSRREALSRLAGGVAGMVLAALGLEGRSSAAPTPPVGINCGANCQKATNYKSTSPPSVKAAYQSCVNTCGACKDAGHTPCIATGGTVACCAGSQSCCSGACCASGQTCCNNACTNLNTDPNHCGSCGNACGSSKVCQNGVCINLCANVTCTASDQCHVAGTCNPATGLCSNPIAANGTACDDGNACTLSDTCQNGVCVGGNPVVCAALDQCHTAGICNPATGLCSNPAAADGTPCDDGDACTQTDTCHGGVCTGSDPVVCSASDQCHTVGTCNPSTGQCSNPAAADGTACDDGDACTQTDTCHGGVCVGGNPVVCAAADQCHTVGTCAPDTGLCSNPAAANGTACDTGDACFQNDTCQGGVCTNGNPVVCDAPGQCHVGPGTCASGLCSYSAVADGTSCTSPSGGVCMTGACTCASPKMNCSGTCIDTQTDPSNCGGCAMPCPIPQNGSAVCNSGVCGFNCQPGFTPQNGQCVVAGCPCGTCPGSLPTCCSFVNNGIRESGCVSNCSVCENDLFGTCVC